MSAGVIASHFVASAGSSVVRTEPLPAPTITTNLTQQASVPLSYVSDGDINTKWLPGQNPPLDSYVRLDYGDVFQIDFVDFYNGDNTGTLGWSAWALEWSADGATWTQIATGGQVEWHGRVNVQARYLRIRSTANQTEWYGIRDFKGYYFPPYTTLHQALPAATASTNLPQSTPIANLADGSLSTYFQPQQNPYINAWAKIDFGAVYEINKVDFHNGNTVGGANGWTAWALEYSTNNIEWFQLATGGAVEYHGTGLSLEARYLRIRSTANQTGWWIMRELSAAYVPA